MTMTCPDPVVLIGAGNMGSAILTGWLKSGIKGSSIIVVDPGPSAEMMTTIREAGAHYQEKLADDVKAGVLLLAVKPQVMDAVLPGLQTAINDDTVVISIAAGKPLSFFERYFGSVPMVRAMPNTPAMIGRGITGVFANEKVTQSQRDSVEALLEVCGPVVWVQTEREIDAVTAVSGSGPAYVFHLVECMAEAGRKLGLDAQVAMQLARETVAGAGELLHKSADDASRLRQNVTSPGGTTAAALDVLMKEGAMQNLFDKAMTAAQQRAGELAG